MATIIGFRDYGSINNNNFFYGAEWANLMLSYTIRHRPEGTPAWYSKALYNHSSYNGRRWGPLRGDSDDWSVYLGFINDKYLIKSLFNYERHGIVSHRPAEVKIEFSLDLRMNYLGLGLEIKYEKQKKCF